MPYIARASTALLLLAFTARAEEVAVVFDAAQTTINWTLAGNVHTVHGTFRLARGRIAFDRTTGSIAGELIVDAGSGDSGSGARDKRMHREVLESDRYGEIKFTPTKLAATLPVPANATVRLTGTFVIHGAPHEVTVPLEVTLSGNRVTAKGNFAVPFVAWGMKDPSNFLFKVDKIVDVEISAVGSVSLSETH